MLKLVYPRKKDELKVIWYQKVTRFRFKYVAQVGIFKKGFITFKVKNIVKNTKMALVLTWVRLLKV